MAQKSIELILLRQISDYLALPVFIVDPAGNLIFCNQAAESVLRFRFSEVGEMPAKEWSVIYAPEDKEGKPLDAEKLPTAHALLHQIPAHGKHFIRTIQNKVKYV